MVPRPRTPARKRFFLEELETRLVPAGGARAGIFVPDFTGPYQIYTPTSLDLLSGAMDNNPGGVLDYNTISIVTPPTKGQVTVDPTTGTFLYTPNYLLPSGLPPGQSPTAVLPEFFTFTIADNLGSVSNIATATFNGGVAPGKGGPLIARDGGGVTNTLQPIGIDLLGYVDTTNGVQVDPASVHVDNPPQHGTVSYDPSRGFITYTPAFGYNGFDLFHYTVDDTSGMWHGATTMFVLINTTATPRL